MDGEQQRKMRGGGLKKEQQVREASQTTIVGKRTGSGGDTDRLSISIKTVTNEEKEEV